MWSVHVIPTTSLVTASMIIMWSNCSTYDIGHERSIQPCLRSVIVGYSPVYSTARTCVDEIYCPQRDCKARYLHPNNNSKINWSFEILDHSNLQLGIVGIVYCCFISGLECLIRHFHWIFGFLTNSSTFPDPFIQNFAIIWKLIEVASIPFKIISRILNFNSHSKVSTTSVGIIAIRSARKSTAYHSENLLRSWRPKNSSHELDFLLCSFARYTTITTISSRYDSTNTRDEKK